MIPVKPEIAAKAHVKSLAEYQEMYRRSIDDPEGFWREQASILDWFYPPRTILDADMVEVDFSWYSGGRLNACYNCVDRHLADKGEKTAILWALDEPGEYRRISYRELKHNVARFANVLLAHGVKKGEGPSRRTRRRSRTSLEGGKRGGAASTQFVTAEQAQLRNLPTPLLLRHNTSPRLRHCAEPRKEGGRP